MPCVFSDKRFMQKKVRWTKNDCTAIKYGKNKFFGKKDNRLLYILQFKYECQYENDVVTFSALEPYGYDRLTDFLDTIRVHQKLSITIETLTKSIGGIEVPIITITPKKPLVEENIKYIVISARVHPGETHASFVCEGLIRHLVLNP